MATHRKFSKGGRVLIYQASETGRFGELTRMYLRVLLNQYPTPFARTTLNSHQNSGNNITPKSYIVLQKKYQLVKEVS